MVSEVESRERYKWQESRKRKDYRGGSPFSGFGPDGSYVLWIPAARPSSRWARGPHGWKLVTDQGVLAEPAIAALRDSVFEGMGAEGGGYFIVPMAFLDYAAAVIRLNYDVTDDDLSLLLGTPEGNWQDAMIRHLLGGNDVVDALLKYAPELLSSALGPPAPPLIEPGASAGGSARWKLSGSKSASKPSRRSKTPSSSSPRSKKSPRKLKRSTKR